MDLGLDGKWALVTGGSRGIGKAVARQLAREGADVVICARDRTRLDATANELSAETGRRILPLVVDTSSGEEIVAMGRAVTAETGGVDVLVNSAARPGGQAPAPKWDEITEQALFADIEVKVLGYLRVAQAVAPTMIERGWGRIVNISGLAARQAGGVVGSIRNVAVAALSKNLADELAPHGVGVVTVHPGMTVTEATTDEQRRRSAHGNLAGRMIDSSEVADVVTFLASPRAVAINGDVIAAGGGVPRAIYY